MIMINNANNQFKTRKMKQHEIVLNITKSTVRMYLRLALILSMFSFLAIAKMNAQCEFINLACNDYVNVSINEDCYASINADVLLEAPPFNFFPDDGVNYDIELTDANGWPIFPSNQVGEEHVGTTITASITLVPCNISCWGYIKVEDKIGPKFWNCVDGMLPDIELDCDDYTNGYVIPDPLLGGVCQAIDALSFIDDTTSLDCTGEFGITIHRLWTAVDEVGNTTQCSQDIRVRRFDLIDVVMPLDYIVSIDPDEDCFAEQDVSPERTGYPTGIHCPNIMYHYSDIEYPQCGLQRKLLRDWFVIDWCTGQSFTAGQIIKLIDDTPPRVICGLDTLMVPMAPYACVASPILNPLRIPGYDTLGAVTVLDTCPEDIFVEVGFLVAEEGELQPINSPYYNIPANEDGVFPLPEFEGSAWIRYCFVDACNNRTEIPSDPLYADSLGYCCYFQLDAKDLTPPTAICEGFTKVPLGAGGLTEVFAESFDDNSYDPCEGISHFEVRREGGSCPGFNESGNMGWGESVHFCCEDLGDTLTIRLRVFDNAGNFSECLGLVCVTDPVTPQITCPDYHVELDCEDDYKDYALIGLPEAEDGCNNSLNLGYEFFDLTNYNPSCGIGTIYRTIDVNDDQGNLLKLCEQYIEFTNQGNTELEDGDFDFPPDITIDICQSGGSIDPVFTGFPTTDKEFGCVNIAINYNDSPALTQNSNGVCYTILREWRVVDWCNYHPSYPDRYVLEGVQEIRVINTALPEFTCPHDISVHTTSYECEAEVPLKISVSTSCPTTFELSWELDAYSDGTVDFTGIGNDATGVYPVGVHSITFSGYNHCGGASDSCTFSFEVIGDKPPVPICLAELTWSLGQNGQTEIWASDFDLKSEGGCGLDELTFSFVDPFNSSFPLESDIFDCDDIPNGIATAIPMEIFVLDESGRYASCHTTLQLQDTQDACPDNSNGNVIGGQIQTILEEPLEQVMVELNDMVSEETMMDMTGNAGSYAFEGLNYFSEYKLRPVHDKDHLLGVTTLDLILIQRHILGMEELDSPYKLIAADADASQHISAIDLIQLRKLILGIYESLPETDSWSFVPKDYKFIDQFNPWNYPDHMYIDDMSIGHENADFVAIKIGDVNDSAMFDSKGIIEGRSRESVFLSTVSESYDKGDLVAVPIILEDMIDMRGLQFTFEFDHESLLFQGVDGAKLNVAQENFALLNTMEGKICFSIHDVYSYQLDNSDVLFTLYFEAKKDLDLEGLIDINSSVTQAEIYSEDFRALDLEFIVKEKELESSKEFQLYQNEPNPFEASTSISFFNPERQLVKLSVMDASGRLIMEEEKEFDAGLNKFTIYGDQLDGSGLLLYRIQCGQASMTRKMIMVK